MAVQNEIQETTKVTEDERVMSVQTELFSLASEEELQRTLRWLKHVRDIELVVRDFKQHGEEYQLTVIEGESARRIDSEEYYANKTSNATIIAQGQHELYLEAKTLLDTLQRAMGLILEEEARTAVFYRYYKGYSYKETLSFMRRGVKSSTIDRRLKTGIISIANTLKMWKVFETDWNF